MTTFFKGWLDSDSVPPPTLKLPINYSSIKCADIAKTLSCHHFNVPAVGE